MKYRNINLLAFLLTLFLTSNYIHGQSNSKEALGNAIVQSIINNDVDSYKSLLLTKEVALKFQENIYAENMDQKERDSLMDQYDLQYDNMIIPRYEKNFQKIVSLNENNEIDWSTVNFVILYKGSSVEEDYIPFFIHTKLSNSDYMHFYFGTVRYNGLWYSSGEMELTKDEKYAPK